MRKLFYVVGAVVLVAGVAFFMSREKQSPDAAVAEAPQSLRVGYVPITDSAPLFVAIRHGLFAKRNLEVEPVAVAGGARAVEAPASPHTHLGKPPLAFASRSILNPSKRDDF